MRSWYPEFLSALFLLALLAGCAGGPESRAASTPVSLAPTPGPVYPFVPGVHRYVEDDDRLVIPTPTARPTSTPRPTLDLSRHVSREDLGPVEPTKVPEELRSCNDHYRGMLIEYRGRIPFGSQAALLLSQDLRERRPDCVTEGWDPLFEVNLVCGSGSVAGMQISPGLTHRTHSLAPTRALPTARDRKGNILVHFARMPLVDARGCWYYNVTRESWAWLISGVGSGIDRPRFPVCDLRLQELVSASAGEDFGPLHVVRALDQVRFQLPSECGSSLWKIFPASGSHEACGAPGNTGLNPEGFLVITWHEDHLPADGAVCWALPPGSTVWASFYPREER